MEEIEKKLKFSPMYYNPNEDDTIYLNLNVSDVCNYRCLKCFQGKIEPDKDSLDLPELLDIIDRAKGELGVKAMYVSGRGETFLVSRGNIRQKLHNYRQLVEHANRNGISIMQFTNGYYLDPEMVDFLVGQDVSMVVSLDTLDEEKYNRLFVAPRDAFRRVMNNIAYARQHFPVEEDGKLYRFGINAAISHENMDEAEQIRDFCGEDIIFFSNYPMIRGNFQENLERMCLSEQEYEDFKQKVRETSAYRNLAGICQNGACGFYYNGITIDINGNILLSPYDISTGQLFGNIKDYDHMNDALEKVRGSIKRFLEKYPDAKGCPLRHPNYENFHKFVGD